MVFAGQTYIYSRNLWPIRFYPDSCTFGGAFAKMGPRANFHTNPAFGATGVMYFNHSLSIFIFWLSRKMNPAVPRRFGEGVQGHSSRHKFVIFLKD
jgi:hypothetical protein